MESALGGLFNSGTEDKYIAAKVKEITEGLGGKLDTIVKNIENVSEEDVQNLIKAGTEGIDNVQAKIDKVVNQLTTQLQKAETKGGSELDKTRAAAINGLRRAVKALTDLKTCLVAKIGVLSKPLQNSSLSAKAKSSLEQLLKATQNKLNTVGPQLDIVSDKFKKIADQLLSGNDTTLDRVLVKVDEITKGLGGELTKLIVKIKGGDTEGVQELIKAGTDGINECQADIARVVTRLTLALEGEKLIGGAELDKVRTAVTDGLGKSITALTQLKITLVAKVDELNKALQDGSLSRKAKAALEELRAATQAKWNTVGPQLQSIIDLQLKNAQDQATEITEGLGGQLDVIVGQLKTGDAAAHDSVQPLIKAGTIGIDNVQAEIKNTVSNLVSALENAKKVGGPGLQEADGAAKAGLAKSVKILEQLKNTLVDKIARLTKELDDTNLSKLVRDDIEALRAATQAKLDTVDPQLKSTVELQAKLQV